MPPEFADQVIKTFDFQVEERRISMTDPGNPSNFDFTEAADGCLRAVASAGVAVVASLHQVHLAVAYADRILALRAGRLVEDAPVADVDARAIEQIYERNGVGATEPRA